MRRECTLVPHAHCPAPTYPPPHPLEHAFGRRLVRCRAGATIVKVQFRYNWELYGELTAMGPLGFEPRTYGL